MKAWHRSRGRRRPGVRSGGMRLVHLARYLGAWRVILGAFVLALGLGTWGFWLDDRRNGFPIMPLNLVHSSLQLFTLNYGFPAENATWLPAPLEIARFMAPCVTVLSVIRGLLFAFHDQVALFSIRRWSGHTVICGLGMRGHLMAEGFLDRGQRVVAIERDPNNPFVEICRERGAVVLIGDGTDRRMLRKAGVVRAEYLVSVCGDDGANIEAVSQSDKLVAAYAQKPSHKRQPHVKALVDISDTLYESVRASEIVDTQDKAMQVEFFDLHERAAHRMLDRFPPFQSTAERPHVLVVGLGRFGKHLVIQTVREWRHQLDVDGKAQKRIKISVIDLDAEGQVALLKARCPDLTDYCRLVPMALDVTSAPFRKGEFLQRIDPSDPPQVVYICLGDDALALPTAVTLSEHLRARCAHDSTIVVRFYQSGGHDAVLRYAGSQFLVCPQLNAFCLGDVTRDPDVLATPTSSEVMAQALHGAYCLHQKAIGQTTAANPSLLPWRNLSSDLRAANRSAALDMGHKLAAVYCGVMPLAGLRARDFTFRQDEVEKLAQMEHLRWKGWWEQKGWRSDAQNPDERNPDRKIRPYLVPWDKLPGKVQEYDRNAVGYIPQALEHAGFQIARLIERNDQVGSLGENKPMVVSLRYYTRASLILEALGIRLPHDLPRDDLPPPYRKRYAVPRAAIVVVGGAAQMDEPERQRLALLFADGLGKVAVDDHVAVLTGGTDIGVMALAGQGVAQHGEKALLLGVCPESKVHWPGKTPAGEQYALEPHHTHFVLTPGSDFGSESFMIYEIMKELERGIPTLALLANGGEIAKQEALTSVRQGRPLVVLKGSGRAADEILAAVEAQQADDPTLRPFLEYARLWVFDVGRGKPEELAALISGILFGRRWGLKRIARFGRRVASVAP